MAKMKMWFRDVDSRTVKKKGEAYQYDAHAVKIRRAIEERQAQKTNEHDYDELIDVSIR